jgi:ornithine cyclodeaminase
LAAIDAATITRTLGWLPAVEALRDALVDGLDPDSQPVRSSYEFGTGELLVMPASHQGWAGVKLATIAPDRRPAGAPRINASYLLFDAASLAPVALLDGTALTSLRTPAVSALAVDLLAPSDAKRLIVFGTGPQAYGHVHAIGAIRPIESVGVVARDARRSAAFAARLRGEGIAAAVTSPAAVSTADLVACCTTAGEPVFDGRALADTAVVVACGSHSPSAREVDSETVRSCGVVVESVPVALAEAGDVILAIADGAIDESSLVTLAQLVRAPAGSITTRPRLTKTVGMGWEDLVVAAAVMNRWKR